MTINDLRETLIQLLGLLRATDAKAATIRDLNEFAEQTRGFGELSLAKFVKLAEAGRTPPTPKPPDSGRRTNGAVGTPDVAELNAAVKTLYEQAADHNVSEEQMCVACDALASLKKGQLVETAATVGLRGMGAKTKEVIIKSIRDRLLDRKRSAIRKEMIHRPAVSEAVPSETTAVVVTTTLYDD